MYVTTGVLLQKIVSAKSLTEFTHIFIDEVGARGPGTAERLPPGPSARRVAARSLGLRLLCLGR